MSHPSCAEIEEPCRWWCPIHGKHHPVASMVEYCLEAATDPRVGIRLAE